MAFFLKTSFIFWTYQFTFWTWHNFPQILSAFKDSKVHKFKFKYKSNTTILQSLYLTQSNQLENIHSLKNKATLIYFYNVITIIIVKKIILYLIITKWTPPIVLKSSTYFIFLSEKVLFLNANFKDEPCNFKY